MTAYIIRRLLWMLPLLIGVSVISFTLLKRAPGDPVSAILAGAAREGEGVTAEDRDRLREQYGLNDPAYVQYFRWLGEITQGNLGESTRSNAPVFDVIKQRLPNTVKLSLVAFILTIIIALPLGIISAVKQYSMVDYILTFGGFAGISVPQFWLALMLLYIFALKLGWLPSFGMQSAYVESGFVPETIDAIKHYILPVTAITIVGLTGYMRYQRAAMLDVIKQDYVRTARAKGLSESKVILKHAWRNALIPIITLLGYVFVILVEGSIVVETIFSWPGMGLLAVDSLQQRDYPVVMAIVLMSSVSDPAGHPPVGHLCMRSSTHESAMTSPHLGTFTGNVISTARRDLSVRPLWRQSEISPAGRNDSSHPVTAYRSVPANIDKDSTVEMHRIPLFQLHQYRPAVVAAEGRIEE